MSLILGRNMQSLIHLRVDHIVSLNYKDYMETKKGEEKILKKARSYCWKDFKRSHRNERCFETRVSENKLERASMIFLT